MRYKIGDRVRVREDLKDCRYYSGIMSHPRLTKYHGQILTISGKRENPFWHEPCYEVKENVWDWSDDMFSELVSESSNEVVNESKQLKYKIGDKVRVRADLTVWKPYSDVYFVRGMEEYCGKVLTITNNNDLFCHEFPCYDVAECYYLWGEDMFEGLEED